MTRPPGHQSRPSLSERALQCSEVDAKPTIETNHKGSKPCRGGRPYVASLVGVSLGRGENLAAVWVEVKTNINTLFEPVLWASIEARTTYFYVSPDFSTCSTHTTNNISTQTNPTPAKLSVANLKKHASTGGLISIGVSGADSASWCYRLVCLLIRQGCQRGGGGGKGAPLWF